MSVKYVREDRNVNYIIFARSYVDFMVIYACRKIKLIVVIQTDIPHRGV